MWVVSALAEGHGHVHCQHGVLPVPVPATANIASSYGLKLHFTDNDGEMVTPTGQQLPPLCGQRTGCLLPAVCLRSEWVRGTRCLNRRMCFGPCCWRLHRKRTVPCGYWRRTWMTVPGKCWALTMEMLLDAGARMSWYTPIHMKKNRPAYMLSVLCRESS